MSTWTDVKNQILQKLPDAGINVISPLKLRESLYAIIDQVIASTPDPVEFEWKATDSGGNSVTYEIGDPVIDDNRWFIAIAQNTNKKPVLPDGSINDDFWREENASTTRYIDNWQAKLYTYPVEIVIHNKKLYLLDRDVVGTGPFLSEDIDVEIAADPSKWFNLTQEAGAGIDPDDIVNDFSTDPNDASKVAGANAVFKISEKQNGGNSTGVVQLDKLAPRVYGETTPRTGDINLNLTESIHGGSAIIHHNDNAKPTIITDLNLYEHGDYVNDFLNKIFLLKSGASSLDVAYTQPVFKAGTVDNTAPTIESATIENGNEDRLIVVFSEPGNIESTAGLSITGDATITVSSILSGNGTNTITFAISPDAQAGQSLTLNVTSSNTVTDLSSNNNPLAATTEVITNNIGVAQQLATPTGFEALNLISTSIRLRWNNVTDADNYVLERGQQPDYSDAITVYSGSNLTFDDTGLTTDTTYYYRVKAIDDVDLIYSDSNYATLSKTTTDLILFEQFVRSEQLQDGTLKITELTSSTVYSNGAYGQLAINGNNKISFKGDTVLSRGNQGLGITNTYSGIVTDIFNMDIWVQLKSDGGLQVFEDGVSVQNTQTYLAEDIISIDYTNGTVTVEKNGGVIYTSAKSYTLPLTPIGLLGNQSIESKIREATFDNNNLTASPL